VRYTNRRILNFSLSGCCRKASEVAVVDCDVQRSVVDFENETIRQQREELRQLIAELRDRDRELNELVSTHQRHVDAWQRDRQRATSLEDKCLQLYSQFNSTFPYSSQMSLDGLA